MHRQCIVSVFACCDGCQWPILAREKLRWPIPVPLTVVSAWRNWGGQWWEFAIVGGGSHVGGVFWGCLSLFLEGPRIYFIITISQTLQLDEKRSVHNSPRRLRRWPIEPSTRRKLKVSATSMGNNIMVSIRDCKDRGSVLWCKWSDPKTLFVFVLHKNYR